MRSRIIASLVALLAGAVPAAGADPTYITTKLPGSGDGQEPRIAVGRDDARYAITLTGRGINGGAKAVVYRSRDGGQTWQKTETDIPQRAASIDVDVITLPSGRLIATELDYGGIDFPTAYSDDGGKTWTASRGSEELADQDRQWLATGPLPKDAKTGDQPPVYLLFHNLASGVAQHNMFVAKSSDGGATFGPPVPVATPGSDAYLDLQCSDSGGPSNITVNPQTGRIYAFYTTRAAPSDNGDAGGCGAPIFGQPIEFNIVNGTRVWVATSADGSPGSWANSLAVDDAKSGQVVSMQLAYGALDNAGNVYVAYPESPHPYPNLEGAAIKLRWQTPDKDGLLSDKGWSPPATLVPADPTDGIVGGANLVHLAAGDPGRVAVAYYYGAPVKGQSTPYFSHILQSYDAQSPTPHVVDAQVSDVPAYKWSTSEMMGLCADSKQAGPLQGVYAGLQCDRSTDVWGIALDASCRVMSTWTSWAAKGRDGTTDGLPNAAPGTFVTTQTDGPGLCAPGGRPPGGSQGAVFQPSPAAALPGEPGSSTSGSGGKPACRDRVAPGSKVVGKVKLTRRSIALHGTAIDHGCGVKGKRARLRVRSVDVAVAYVPGFNRCRFVRGDGTFGPVTNCRHPTYVVASGRSSFALKLKGKFPKGHYYVWTKATDVVNNQQRKPPTRHLVHLRLR